MNGMSEELIVSPTAPVSPASGAALTSAQFRKLAEVPPEIEWLANIDSLQTRRAYQNDLRGSWLLPALSALRVSELSPAVMY
jgi:hypothetical protein